MSGPVLVTGGGGFVGRAVVRRLLDRGVEVRSLARNEHPELRAWGVDVRQGDLADPTVVSEATRGCGAVIHVAARAGVWGPRVDYERTNFAGTVNVIAACREHGVERLVYTSTPSVVHGGGDIAGADESLPLATRFETAYPESKARAERAVLAANGAGLATTALRPHLVWGPGDPHLVPRLVDRARAGRLALVGTGDNLVDTTYIDNAAQAHLLAWERLRPGAACAGRAYFISNGEPKPMAEVVNGILAAAGVPPVTRRVPFRVAWLVGALLELAWWATRRAGEPPMTRFVARQLSTAHWYDISAARRDLGYAPEVDLAEGLRRLAQHLGGQRGG